MAPDPIRAALYARLDGDATLKALATGGIHHAQAPQGTEPPYVIFHCQAPATPLRTFGEDADRPVWLVKGVCRGTSASKAEEINARCRALLNRVLLTVAGSPATVVLEGGVNYAVPTDGDPSHHICGLYRIHT